MQTLTITSGNAVAVKPKAIPKHQADSLARSHFTPSNVSSPCRAS
jgi:hypothetical protein